MGKFLPVAALTATLLATGAASAAESIPLTLGYVDDDYKEGDPGRADGQTTGDGTFVDFAVRLEAGKDYFFAGVSDSERHIMELRSPGSDVLRRGTADDEGRWGFEYRAATTATYFLRFVQVGGLDTEEAAAYAGPDCRSGTSTACTLRLGTSRRGRWDFTTGGDPAVGEGITEWDAYKVRLVRGRTYTATLGGSPRLVAFVGADGRVLASTELPPDGRAEVLRATFRPKRTGYYWVRAGGRYDSSYYNLLVK